MRDVRLNIRGAFSDSKIFYGGGSYHAGRSGRAWAKRGQPRKRDRRRAASRAHVYAAVTPYGATPLYFATGTTGVKGPYSRPRRVTKARLQEACQQLDLDARGTHAELMARIAGLGEDSDAVVQALGARPRASGVGNEEYMDILTGTGRYAQSRGMLGAIAHLFAPSPHAGNWWFQQDGARAHTLNPKTAAGRRTEAAILKVAPKMVRDWPARSPDLSLIENAWARCEDYLWKHESWGDSAEFCAALERAWRASVTPEYCRNLFPVMGGAARRVCREWGWPCKGLIFRKSGLKWSNRMRGVHTSCTGHYEKAHPSHFGGERAETKKELPLHPRTPRVKFLFAYKTTHPSS
mmetsp:Transcript_1261/g.4025  ORF Transcript_1261/g.4025 Transcript_1261/m.4025 type:complete len:350 (-) Transcript_1261:698-1747(-)